MENNDNNSDIKLLTLNTSLSSNSSISNPSYYLQYPLYNVQGYAVNNFSGLNTILNIDGRNNKIKFIENGQSINAFLPYGNYTISSFIAKISLSMSTSGNYTYTVTNNILTNILTISATGAFQLLDTTNNCYLEMGFNTLGTLATSQTATSPYNLSGVNLIHLVCPSFNGGSNVVGSNYNIICSIPVSSPYLGVISYNNCSPHFITSANSEISTLQFILLDQQFRPITLMNNWSLSLYVKLD